MKYNKKNYRSLRFVFWLEKQIPIATHELSNIVGVQNGTLSSFYGLSLVGGTASIAPMNVVVFIWSPTDSTHGMAYAMFTVPLKTPIFPNGISFEALHLRFEFWGHLSSFRSDVVDWAEYQGAMLHVHKPVLAWPYGEDDSIYVS